MGTKEVSAKERGAPGNHQRPAAEVMPMGGDLSGPGSGWGKKVRRNGMGKLFPRNLRGRKGAIGRTGGVPVLRVYGREGKIYIEGDRLDGLQRPFTLKGAILTKERPGVGHLATRAKGMNFEGGTRGKRGN